FETADGLTAVGGIGPVTANRLTPYLSVGSRSDLRRDLYLKPKVWIHNSSADAYSRFRRIVGNPDGYSRPDTLGGYLGSPVNYYQRVHYRSDHLSANLTQAKRPGERLPGPLAFNNQSGYASLEDLGRLKIAVAGNYSMRMGQGLIMGSGISLGKGQDVIRSANRSGAGVRGFTSGNTAGAFRGAAVTWGERIRVTGFYSSRKRTAAVVEGDTIRFPVSTPQGRTLAERERRLNTGQQTAGGRISMDLPAGVLGAGGYVNRFSRPVQKGPGPWQQHSFGGTTASALSIDYRFTAGPAHMFGEAGRTGNGAVGVVSGVEMTAGDGTEFAIALRHYEPDFQSIFGSSFAEQSGTPRNEEGWYLGVRHRLREAVRLSAYFDRYHFPAPRYLTRQPTGGYDWLGMAEYRPDRQTELYLLVRQKVREQEYDDTDSAGRDIRLLSRHRRLVARIQSGIQIHPRVRLRNRAEWTDIRPAGGGRAPGFLLYQDIRFQARHNLQIDARVTLFDTDGFEARAYHFENDLLYVFSSTMLFDQGQRFYILFNYRPSEKIQVWFKASTTIYENRLVVGSGLDRLPRNHRSDIGMQVRLRL
ncbi:MAG: hypothetical protein WD317_04400, partial [Balneolaceae bacterium]